MTCVMCLEEAFENMSQRGLVAKPEFYCTECGPAAILNEVQQWREQQKEVRGFAFLRASHESEEDDVPLSLVFGTLAGSQFTYDDPKCLEIGDIVAACLKEQYIAFEW